MDQSDVPEDQQTEPDLSAFTERERNYILFVLWEKHGEMQADQAERPYPLVLRPKESP